MPQEKYAQAQIERAKHGEVILASPSSKKLVVAGPGTGKTHLFKQVLHNKNKTLTLSFVNALVADLALELCGLSDVRTLHGYARAVLAESLKKSVRIHPALAGIVQADAKILLGQDIDFAAIFHQRDDNSPHLPFYRTRKNYYDHYGYADIVFAAARYFEEKPDKIPVYDQVVVDEFQDFNPLEVSLIELLAQKSPVLLAGDDDQALYPFKHASPVHIRQRHTPGAHGYAAFNLPYCSRCPRVIVEATNDLIVKATAAGRLVGRINKPYIYFDEETKDRESARHPKIVHAKMQAAQIPWFINHELGKIAQQERRSFTVLIISPITGQSRTVVTKLKEKGLTRIDFTDRKDGDGSTMLDGLKLMLEPKQKFGNLGWRIAAQHILTAPQLAAALTASAADPTKPFHQLIPAAAKQQITPLEKTLRRLKDGVTVADVDFDALCKAIGRDPRALVAAQLQEEVDSDSHGGNAALRTIPIKATTIQSSKGLAADYVFITHFDDAYFIKGEDKAAYTDQDVCNFLVALTRAKKKAYLLSPKPTSQPLFRTWIEEERIEEVILGEA